MPIPICRWLTALSRPLRLLCSLPTWQKRRNSPESSGDAAKADDRGSMDGTATRQPVKVKWEPPNVDETSDGSRHNRSKADRCAFCAHF